MGKYPYLSERKACRILRVPRSTLRYAEVPAVDETTLRHGVLAVANLYGRYGYRTVCGLLSSAGWETSEAVVRSGDPPTNLDMTLSPPILQSIPVFREAAQTPSNG